MSAFASDIPRQLLLFLKSSQDAPSLPSLLQRVDDFVSELLASSHEEAVLGQLEDELQNIYHQSVDHTIFSQTEIFLSVLYHLLPLLPSSSVISTWFDLVLRPALREPKLPTEAIEYAKELIIAALNPGPIAHDNASVNSEKDRRWEKVGDFRRRLMDLYLLDAYNDSSGDDVLEWAKLDDSQREKMACWKTNLEDVLVRAGLQRPQVSSPSTIPVPVMVAHNFGATKTGSPNGAVPLFRLAIFPSTTPGFPYCVHLSIRFPYQCGGGHGWSSRDAKPPVFPLVRYLLNGMQYWPQGTYETTSHLRCPCL